MKRYAALAAGLALSALFGCSTAQQQSAAGNLTKLQTTVVNGCSVVQPTLQSIAVLDPAVAAAATANGLFCSTAGAITVSSVQTLLATGVPAMEKAINESTQIPANQKPIFIAAIGIFSLTLQNAMTVYGQPAAASMPASSAK